MQCRCPKCGRELNVPPELYGRRGKCPACQTAMMFPAPQQNAAVAGGMHPKTNPPVAANDVAPSPSANPRQTPPKPSQPANAATTAANAQDTKKNSQTDAGEFRIRQCRVCSHINPPDAYYCFFDGTLLSTKHQPAFSHAGTLAFPTVFYFTDGTICENFNQLAFGCNNHWEEARSHLAEGNWPPFFGGLGRMDLVAAAKQAALEPDLDRGLSQLLAKLPAEPDFLRPPKLALQPAEENLGQLAPGQDRKFEITVANQGMLLLQGTIWTDCDWLIFGDRAGRSQKVFQTRDFYTLTVRIPGDKLRAGRKPLKGEIVVETNGGNLTFPVTAEVPVHAFPGGVDGNDLFANAKSPGELAVKARQYPNEAAVSFEVGAVKRWYERNGWTYPVEGAAASGKAAVQQFFEALGLTKPPRLQINKTDLVLKGKAGQRLSTSLTVFTQESKPVFAHGSCDQNWVELGPYLTLGKKVKILVEFLVPSCPGQTVPAEIRIRGNGNQQFVVTVAVAVEAESVPSLKLVGQSARY